MSYLSTLAFALIVAIGDLFFEGRLNYKKLGIYILLAFLFNFMTNTIFGNEYEEYAIRDKATFSIVIPKALNDYDKCYYEGKMSDHLRNAERYYEDAKNRCWYLPTIDDREKARTCFYSTIILIGPGTHPAKAILALLNLLNTYGFACMSEWHTIQDKLRQAQYHYEMYEFFRDVIAYG